MEKNVALAMFLIFAIWMTYILIFAPKPKPIPLAESGRDTVETSRAQQRQEAAPGEPAPAAQAGEEPLVKPDTLDFPVDTVVVSSELYEYSFITRGGILSRASLKKFPAFETGKNRGNRSEGPVQLIPPEGSLFLYSRLYLKSLERPIELGSRHFETRTTRLNLSKSKPEGSVEFISTLSGGNEIRIVYTFHNDSYLVGARLYLPDVLYGSAENTLEVALGPTLVSNEKDPKDDHSDYGVVYYDNGEVVRKSLKDLGKSDWAPSGTQSILWGGLKSKYFLASFFVPDKPMSAMHGSGNPESLDLAYRGMFPIPTRPEPIDFSFYLGPQSYEQLTRLNFGLTKLFQYGWAIIQPFCKILLKVLLWMHQWVSNYALILVLFALLYKVVSWPLTIKSTKSQIKMQQIQPLMNELKVKYKDDPKKMQEETLRMYKEYKVNPLGGCLPILVQMPVLIALFYVFRLTIEFRGAEAFGWIHDLSQPDPYYILPVAMGLTQFVMQKLTPTPTDPKMVPMLYIMPVFMVFIFLNFSSGLVFYYTFVNIFQLAQQLYINRRYHAPALAVAGAGQARIPQAGAAAEAKKTKKGRKK
ncbi:MAG: hypothetical protein A3F83_04730 [Candidatus Glassbacteria bacterium RIFCSPLOWO2_12_FULL_58_11]|uniref:Membrane protein insertase YidC n=1 Tax=Candidatus Glassbacteria bacterium RIFCSPLOWO2_12_FULL_58_11 TaxID=1817867 RepID=A0A1F5YKD8_9BACT|nr:MAG: hypothetical protein A3F83_04730 [Candidatus Glassbacteria bacterium RIFCSPLOWO2_12_FULL_58_11]